MRWELLKAAIWVMDVERSLFRLFLFMTCLHLLKNAWQAWRARHAASVAAAASARLTPPPEDWPTVTVQITTYNEKRTAARAVQAAAAMDYPRNRFDIQVLDDSTDHTRDLINDAVTEIKQKDIAITVLRRPTRAGAKAGNLAYGTERATGDFLAIFDADAVPKPEFLKVMMLPLMRDPGLTMVQARWTFRNRNASVLTRVQALLLDGLMAVEQVAHSSKGAPFQFNGSAGIWRRADLEGVGGWKVGSVVEDLDLSYRAILAGKRFAQLPEPLVSTELPDSMVAWRKQQHRWAAGKAQILREMAIPILTSKLPLIDRISMVNHIAGRVIHVFLLLLTFTVPLTTLNLVRPFIRYTGLQDALIFVAVVLSMIAYYAPSRLERLKLLRTVVLMPAVLGLIIGMSYCYARAILFGLLAESMEFVTTPKQGSMRPPSFRPPSLGPPPVAPPGSVSMRPPSRRGHWVSLEWFCFVEIATAFLFVTVAVLARLRNPFGAAFCAMWSIGYFWVGFGTLWGTLKRKP